MFGLFKKKEVSPIVRKPVELLQWRPNMWAMSPDGIGIIFKLGPESEVHLVNEGGYTVGIKSYPIGALRQAKFDEIPSGRRKISKETASKLGYF